MQVTVEEFESLIKVAGYYGASSQDKYNHSFTEHLMSQTEEDLKFRAFIKNHYPEALDSWVALQKIKES